MAYKKNYYIILRFKILFSMMAKGKLSLKKALNAAYCFLAYFLRLGETAKYPFMMNFELWNECNANCLFCRTIGGDIYDQNPEGSTPIPKGMMDYELYTNIIDQVKDYLLMAVLYVNGEPLLYKDLYRALKYASDRHVATMIATNGQLLTEKNIVNLLDAGLGFIKIAISGFTQEIYKRQHRKGNVERVKENIRTLVRLNKEGRHGLVIMMDYIFYNYNAHELADARRFCDELGIMLNVRPGNLRGLEDMEPLSSRRVFEPIATLCDWPWKIITVNWNGDLLPCCDYVVWSSSRPYARFEKDKSDIAAIWNGIEAVKTRMTHVQKGRRAIPICAQCPRQGTAFKY